MPPNPPTAAIKTLGCKLNQFESQQIREQLVRLGFSFVPFESVADVYIINSCTVTARTDRDCRRLIRHAHKLNPEAFIAVTGCYAQVHREQLEAIPEADLVVGNDGKASLGQRIAESISPELLASQLDPATVLSDEHHSYAEGEMLEGFAEHSRAFLKVQEGCDAHCAYCIIPQARGTSRSVPPEEVLDQAQRLIEAGFPELVLIGIHLGKYGLDLEDAPDLTGLLRALIELPGLGRVRLSSIEPREVGPELIELVTGHPRLCRHLHIPLQSGCDTVLERMGRPYDTAFYADLLRRIHGAEPATCLGADVMVGFPGETDEEFETTFRLIEALPLNHLHVFTYSVRPGTRAADMPNQVPHEVKIARNHRLRDLSLRKRVDFARRVAGQTLSVVLERPAADLDGVFDGLSDNYLRVLVPAEERLRGRLVRVRTHSATGDVLRGELEQG